MATARKQGRGGRVATPLKRATAKVAKKVPPRDPGILAEGTEPFTIASRIVREFGERLVKQPEVALLELVKNAYDADASECTIDYAYPTSITISDDGHGMTLEEFLKGWMRIGTTSKNARAGSRLYGRRVSGEKGIGRFAVSYLGRYLTLTSVADDPERGMTELTATFDWPTFDRQSDLGTVTVPYVLRRAVAGARPGTILKATKLRPSTETINFREVQTSSLGLLSPYRALLRRIRTDRQKGLPPAPKESSKKEDPGFDLFIRGTDLDRDAEVASKILSHFVFRCVIAVENGRVSLRLYRRGETDPVIEVDDSYEGDQGRVYADLRFFPARKGTFAGMNVDGRLARTWLRDHAGVAVFDRNFRVLPYGTPSDDWLRLAADTARNERKPQSSLARLHFPMNAETLHSTQLNYMLRLPLPSQLVGAVQVFGLRTRQQTGDRGLVATADRQGFVNNKAFTDLRDIVRGAAEVIAYADREWQQELLRDEIETLAETAAAQTREAVAQIRANPVLSVADKSALIKRLNEAQQNVSRSEDLKKSRDAALEVMSLLGVVAGFMTHEFGTALHELTRTYHLLVKHAEKDPEIARDADALAQHIQVLKEFVAYSQGYVKGASIISDGQVPAKPRIQQVVRVFGKYASDRNINIKVEVDSSVKTPRVPLSLYGGLVLNLYTNALKAVVARANQGNNAILICAWEQGGRHRIRVSDTGVGIPSALSDRVFDPLFTTTESRNDPLGSGMGLGLTLVRRSAKAFGGSVQIVAPPDGYTTCIEVSFPIKDEP